MRTWAQRAWEAEQYAPAPEECLDCHGPILDRGISTGRARVTARGATGAVPTAPRSRP
jgi:hypothetical protein